MPGMAINLLDARLMTRPADPTAYASSMQIDRKLFDDDQFHIATVAALANAMNATMQVNAAKVFNNAFEIEKPDDMQALYDLAEEADGAPHA